LKQTRPQIQKNIGLTPFIYCANHPPLPVSADVPIGDALAQASDLLFLIKPFAENVDYDKKPPAIPRALISWRR